MRPRAETIQTFRLETNKSQPRMSNAHGKNKLTVQPCEAFQTPRQNKKNICSPGIQIRLVKKFFDLVIMQTALFMFQYYHNPLPKVFDNYFKCTSSKHNYNTRLEPKSTYYTDQARTNYDKFNLRAFLWSFYLE